MNKEKKCIICNRNFSPDIKHPYQKICFRRECRVLQKSLYLKRWRIQNPDYFKNRKDNIEKMKEWREKNKDYYKKYRMSHPKIKELTKQYVKNFRKRCKQKQILVD